MKAKVLPDVLIALDDNSATVHHLGSPSGWAVDVYMDEMSDLEGLAFYTDICESYEVNLWIGADGGRVRFTLY